VSNGARRRGTRIPDRPAGCGRAVRAHGQGVRGRCRWTLISA